MVEERYHYQEAVDRQGQGCSENFETLFVEKKFCDSHIYSFTPGDEIYNVSCQEVKVM